MSKINKNKNTLFKANGVRHTEKINSYTKNLTKKSLVRHTK